MRCSCYEHGTGCLGPLLLKPKTGANMWMKFTDTPGAISETSEYEVITDMSSSLTSTWKARVIKVWWGHNVTLCVFYFKTAHSDQRYSSAVARILVGEKYNFRLWCWSLCTRMSECQKCGLCSPINIQTPPPQKACHGPFFIQYKGILHERPCLSNSYQVLNTHWMVFPILNPCFTL